MSEMVLSMETLPKVLDEMISTDRVKLREIDGVISLTPLHEVENEECVLLGLTAGSTLTVEKFLAMTREDKMLERLES